MYVCMYVYVYIYIYIYICTYIWKIIRHMFVRKICQPHSHVCSHARACMHACEWVALT